MNTAGWSKIQRRTIVENFGFEKAHELARKSSRKVRKQAAQKEYNRRVAEWDLGDRIDTIIDDLEFSESAQRRLFRAGMGNIPKASRPSLEDLLNAMTSVIIMKSRSKEEAIRRLEKIEELAEQEEPAEEEPVEKEHADEENGAGISHERHGEPSVNPSTNPPERKIDPSKPRNWLERLFGVPEHRRRRH